MAKKKYPPNPLPCGCGAKGIPDLDCMGTRIEYRDVHVVHCPLHAAAPDMLKALQELLSRGIADARTMDLARAAVRRATAAPP